LLSASCYKALKLERVGCQLGEMAWNDSIIISLKEQELTKVLSAINLGVKIWNDILQEI